jgi:hypothetical protein
LFTVENATFCKLNIGDLNMTKTVTKTTQVLNAFVSGQELTAKQMASRFGVQNPTATVSNIRRLGYAIYGNRTATGGTKYRLGTPSRRVIAAGYAALGRNA